MRTTKRCLGGFAPAGRRRPVVVFTAGLAALAAVLAGCVPISTYPFYRVGDLVQDASLVGVWQSADGQNSWIFTPGRDKSCNLEIQSEGQRVVCVAHLFKLGSERFLDLYPAEQALGDALEKNPYSVGLIPGHALFRVLGTTPKLRLSGMGMDWLKEELKRNPNAAAHVELPDGRVAFTGRTEAVQAFITKHLHETGAWNAMFEDGLARSDARPAEKPKAQ